MNFKPYLF